MQAITKLTSNDLLQSLFKVNPINSLIEKDISLEKSKENENYQHISSEQLDNHLQSNLMKKYLDTIEIIKSLEYDMNQQRNEILNRNNYYDSIVIKYSNELKQWKEQFLQCKTLYEQMRKQREDIYQQNKLTTYDLINTKKELVELKSQLRQYERERYNVELIHFQYEDNISQQQSYIEKLQEKAILNELSKQIEKDYLNVCINYQETQQQLTDLQEKYNILYEDYNGLLKEHQKIKSNENQELKRLQFEIITLRTQNKSLVAKSQSLSRDLLKRLQYSAPINRELSWMRKRIEEITNERNAFRDAMTTAISQHIDQYKANKNGERYHHELKLLTSCINQIGNTEIID